MKVMLPISSFVMCEASNSTQGGNSGEKKSFDTFNIQMLEHILQPLSLCSQFSQREVIETFREFQDFIHTNYQGDDFAMHGLLIWCIYTIRRKYVADTKKKE